MRKKREQQKQAAVKAEAEKNKNIPGDDKILNILSNTENQRLINNLLGIGKTLGLTGKQNISASLLPPPPPPPLSETTSSNNQPAIQGMQQIPSQANIRPNVAPPNWSNQQQPWGNQQYNIRMEAPGYGPGMPTMPPMLSTPNAGPPQMISPNFAQSQPNLPSNITPNFSQPPPNFPTNDRIQSQNVKAPGPTNMKDCPPFGLADSSNTDVRFMHPNDRPSHNFDGQLNFRRSDQERFGRDNINPNLHEQDQFRSTDTLDKGIEAQHFRKGDRNYSDFGNNQLTSQNNFNPGNDRFAPANDRFKSGNDRFNRETNRFGPMGSDRFISGGDRFGLNNDRLGPGSDRFNNEWFGQEDDRFRPGDDRLGMDKDRRGSGNDRFPDNERFGSDKFALGGEQFVSGTDRFDSKDRFFSGNDRFGSNSEQFRSNDRFGRSNADYFDPKDSADLRRDSFGTNARGFNRNPSFSPPNELSPELKKLMEKRKAAGDVFRPSFIDSDKSTSIGSLSESFKKITGDSPFKNSFDFQKNPPNRGGLGSSESSSFQLHSSDSGQIFTSPYGPRDHLFSRDNESSFRGHLDNFAKSNPMDYNNRVGKNIETIPPINQSQPTNVQSQDAIKHPEKIEIADSDSSLQTNNIADTKDTEAKQANEANSSIEQNDTVTSGGLKDDNGDKSKVISDDNSLQHDDKKRDDNQIQNTEKINESNDNDNGIKQLESLPFMGENDARPEDLNIEPPPELPNLYPITMDSNQNMPLNSNKDFDRKGPDGNQFDIRFNNSFGPKGIEFKSSTPFGPRGPPMFGPRGPHMFPTGPSSSPFLPQGSMDVQLSPRGPKDGQFGLNTSSESRFSPRKANDEQCSDRDRNDDLSGLPNSEKFDSHGPTNELIGQFGSRAPFGVRGSIDRQIGPRGPTDSPFSPRNPGPFGPRGNNMQFGPRGINDRLDSRTISERPFGPRGSNDGLYGPKGPSDIVFGTRRLSDSQFGAIGSNKFSRANEAPFDKKPSFDNIGSLGFCDERTLGSRRFNEGLTGPRGSNESISLGSRDSNDALLQRNPKNFNENRFESRDSNNESFGSSDFKAKGSMNDSTNVNFLPLGDSLLNRGDYMRRNPYIRKEQFEDNIFAKRAKYESPKPTDEFSRSCPDKNIDVEMRKENTNEYVRRIPDLSKKELETAVRPGPSDTWKDKFGSGQRPNAEQHNVDRNVPNTFDERPRSERTTIESKGDYKSRYGECAAGSDFQSKYASNIFMKRPLTKGQEFCVQRQFNYNHGEGDKKFVEPLHFTPAKVIDYGHTSRPSITDQHLLSVQCFDYGHGNLKPAVDREQQQQHSKRDFRNWVENEQNLKEYTEKMSNYENMKGYAGKTRNYATNYDARRSMDYNKRKEYDWSKPNEKKTDREENDDRKEKGYKHESESQNYERNIDNDQSDRYQTDRNIHKGNLT